MTEYELAFSGIHVDLYASRSTLWELCEKDPVRDNGTMVFHRLTRLRKGSGVICLNCEWLKALRKDMPVAKCVQNNVDRSLH